MSPLALLAVGLVLGMRHAADPDHVVAVTAIAARTRNVFVAAWLAIIWGLGHTLTLFAAGGAIIVFNLVVPPRIGLSLEFVAALALVVVGLLNLRPPRSQDGPAELSQGRSARLPAGRAFVVGLVHGLAGSAAVALLVLATVRNVAWACGYLVIFGAGTLLGMVLVTTAIASPLTLASRRWDLGRGMRLATGALSFVFGAWLIYQIGWRDGLFLAAPHWEPH